MSEQPEDTIEALEEELLQEETRRSESRLRELLADGFIEFGSSGIISDKKDALGYLPTSPPADFKVYDFETRILSPDCVLATYRVEKTDKASGEIHLSLRSSLWQKRAGDWQMIFHQGTPLSP